MALTAQNDSGQSESTEDAKVMHIKGRNKVKIGKTFVPNPEAEPFVPDIKATQMVGLLNNNSTWNGHGNVTIEGQHTLTGIHKNDPLNGTMHIMSEKLINGLSLKMSKKMPALMSHSSPNSEDETPPLMISAGELITNGNRDNHSPMKKHIAFHLLSNLLDDEIVEDNKNVNNEVVQPNKEPVNELLERNESWPASVSSLSSSFSLNLDHNENTNQSTSFTNRSIHEIWSPNPSPKGSYPSTPSEDNIPYFPSSHENLESPFHKGSMDIIVSRAVVSPVIPSPATPMEYVLHQNGSVGGNRQYSPTYPIVNGNGYASSPSPTNIHNNHNKRNSFDHHVPPMNAIRALQFNGDECHQNGVDDDITDDLLPSPSAMDEGLICPNKIKKLQVHFEEHGRPRNGIIIRPKEEFTETKEDSVPSAKKLGGSLDECLDQLRHLEAECRKAEQELSKIYPSRRRLSSSSGCYMPRLPVNPTRVDKMIVEQSKVHDKIESLVGRIERMGRSPLHPNVGVALDQWLACIKELQSLRRDEINNSPGSVSGSYGCKSYYDRDLLALACCVKELITHTRAARTTIWCAMQMLHADEGWLRRSESCSSLERNSDQMSTKS